MKWKNLYDSRWGFGIFLALATVIFTLNMTSARATSAVQRVADIYPGATGSSPTFMTNFHGKLYFAADGNDGAGRTLWMYDGVNLPVDVLSGMPNLGPNFLTVFNDKLYFAASNIGTTGRALWEYDGINPPTLVADVSGHGVSFPMSLVVFNNKLYFMDTLGFNYGSLWMYDGVNPPSQIANFESYSYGTYGPYLTVFNDKLYFAAISGYYGNGLWVYDGINPPSVVWAGNWEPESLTVFNGKLYFQASTDKAGSPSRLLWVYDGVNSPSHAVDIQMGWDSAITRFNSMTVYHDKLYFQADGQDGAGLELWSYDGVTTSRVADIYSGSLGSYPTYLAVYNDVLYFRVDGGDGAGYELWSYSDIEPPTSTPAPTETHTPTATPTATYTPTATATPINTVTFGDVPRAHWAWLYVEKLYHAGITGGCSSNPLLFCPDTAVTRAQMSVFLLRGIHGSAYVPPSASGTKFVDVPANYWAAAWIEELANEGITGGCGNGNYCPDSVVTRDQMAILLLRAKHGAGYVPPAVNGILFADVASSYWAVAWIEQLANEGITSGCGNGYYCPTAAVTRAQMAVFLVNTFISPPALPTATFTKTPTYTPSATATPTKTMTPSPTICFDC